MGSDSSGYSWATTVQSCAFICRALLKAGVPFSVDIPGLSFIWLQPCFEELLAHSRVEFILEDQCPYGTEWRKRTGFLCGNIPSDVLTKLACRCKSFGGGFDRTSLRHRHLIGSAKGGGSMTSKAQSYPPALATLLAGILPQAAAMKISRYNCARTLRLGNLDEPHLAFGSERQSANRQKSAAAAASSPLSA